MSNQRAEGSASGAYLMSKEQVVRELQRLSTEGRVVKRRELPEPLFLALRAHFGSLVAARRAAGIAPVRPRRIWSEKRVVDELQALDRLGVEMRAADIKEAGPAGILFALYRYVRSMERARELAGLPKPPRRNFNDPWDEDRVIAEIWAIHEAGGSLAMSKVDPRLHDAGGRFFGSWREAIETAGFDYAKVRLVRVAYRRKEVIQLLRRLAKRHPRMTVSELNRHAHGRAARKVFGTTARGIAAARIKDWPVRKHHAPMSKREVIDQLRARKRDGAAIYERAVQSDAPRLRRSGLAHWGRWPLVLAAAHLTDDAPVRRRWSKKAILDQLRDRKRRGFSLRPSFVQADDPGLVTAAATYFGSYRAAAKEVGFDSARHPWSRERVISELRRRANGATRVTMSMAGPALTLAAWKLFGKFSKACQVAGLEVHTVRHARTIRTRASSGTPSRSAARSSGSDV